MEAALIAAGLTKEQISQTLATIGVDGAQKAATGSTWSFATAWKGLSAAIAANPIGFALTAITMIATVALPLIDGLVQSSQKAIEKANELSQAWKDQQSVIQSNSATIAEISSDYETLSKGVSKQGKNISLSTEEYKRYNEIVNQIAEMFPKMVSGYTQEGNAILVHKGNVEELTKAYQEQKQAAYEAIVVGSSDVYKNFKRSITVGAVTGTDIDIMKEILDNIDDKQALASMDQKIKATLDLFTNPNSTFSRTFKSINLGAAIWDADANAEKIQESKQLLFSTYNQMISELNTETLKVKPILTGFLETDFNFKALSGDIQDAIRELVGSFDYTFFKEFNDSTEMYAWIQRNIIAPLSDPSTAQQVQDALTTLLSLDPKTSVAQYTSSFKEALSALPTELKDQLTPEILIKLGVDYNPQEIQVLIDEVTDKIYKGTSSRILKKSLFTTGIENELTIEDLKIVARPDFIIDPKADIRTQINDYIKNSLYSDLPALYKSFTDLSTQFSDGAIDSDKYVASLNEQLDSINNLIRRNPELANGYNIVKDSIEAALSLAPQALKDLREVTDDLVESAKTLSSAFGEQIENGRLSADTILSLIDAGYASVLSFDAETGAVKINAQACIDRLLNVNPIAQGCAA